MIPFLRMSALAAAAALFAAVLAAAPADAAPARTQTLPSLVRTFYGTMTSEAFESGGSAWIDLNGDLFPDVFVPHGNLSLQNSSLFVHTAGSQFQKVVTGPEVTTAGTGIGAVFGDYDRDGHPDLFVTCRSGFGNFLYRGLGDTLFTRVTTGDPVTDPKVNSNSGSWLDLDNDGNLDLYVLNFTGDDYLYMNSGPPAYNLVRTAAPSLTTGTENSIHGAWADFDGDGDEDLFVANGGDQDDELFINQGGLNFTKRVIPDGSSSLGGSWGDYDNDGYLDLFVPHNLNEPSILYHNSGPPDFDLVPVPAGSFPAEASQSVGSAWGDYDNDGNLDLFVANDGPNNVLYRNSGPPGYTFTKVTGGDPEQDGGNSFGCEWVDYDRDGALDLFVANRANEVNFMYHNSGPTGHFLELGLTGTLSNPQAIGARVRVRAVIGGAPRWMLREITPLTGYNSENYQVHFGLGDATVVDSMIVRWPSGRADTLTQVRGDRILALTEGQPLVASAPAPRTGDFSLRLSSANPARSASSLVFEYTLPRETDVRLELFTAGGRRVGVVREGRDSAGPHSARFSPGSPMAAGVYWCRLQSGAGSRSVPLVLVH